MNGAVTLKEWRFDVAARLKIKPESVWMRLYRGKHPEVEVVKINHQRQFVKVKARGKSA